MKWCEKCLPESCPLVSIDNHYIKPKVLKSKSFEPTNIQCLDEPISKNGSQWCHSCDVNLRVCAWLNLEELKESDSCYDARMESDGQIKCRSCDMSMALGSSSLSMEELARAYSAFGTYGQLVEPYYIEKVIDRDGTIIESHNTQKPNQVLDPALAGISHWLVREVSTTDTAARTNRLKMQVAGKTGTTDNYVDAWFVGYNPDLLTATWLGHEQPRSMGVSFTGGYLAVPFWMDFMKMAITPPDGNVKNAPKFKNLPRGIEWVRVDENTGKRSTEGRRMPMLLGTGPKNIVTTGNQKTIEDLEEALFDGEF